MNATSNTLGIYTAAPQAPMSEYYSTLRVLGRMVAVPQAPQSTDQFGFSRDRWLQGEADAKAGRVHTLDEVMNALRAQVRGNGL